MPSHPALFFTVEHGDNKIPAEYAPLFVGQESVLASHRGYDPGAGELAVRFSTRFHAPYEHAEICRLLVDQNRSIQNRRALFSEYTRKLPEHEKQHILETYYWPYRNAVKKKINDLFEEAETLLHLAIHSFTPELHGEVRHCDIGLMYDPTRKFEKEFSCRWQNAIHQHSPDIRVRRNYPYRGISDGIVLSMRQAFPSDRYVGLQIEVNQRFPFGDREKWKKLQKIIVESFDLTLKSF